MTRLEKVLGLVRWGMLVAVAALAAYTTHAYWAAEPHAHDETREDRYYCPMHPEIRSPEPGECPICHMQLEPIPAERRSEGPSSPADPGTPEGLVPVEVTLDRQQLVGIATTRVEERVVGETLTLPASVEAREGSVVEVRTRAAAYVERLVVGETGLRVSRGQPLAYLYSPDVYRTQQELLAAASTGPSAGPSSEAIVAEGRRGLELLGLAPEDVEAALRSGRAVRDLPLRAPAAGYVTQFSASRGRYVTPEDVLYEISDLSRVYVVAGLSERDLPKVRRGMVARFVPTSGPAIDAVVELVEPTVDPSTRSARLRLLVENRALALRPGQLGNVEIRLPEAPHLLVPSDAVIDTGTARYVFVDRGEGRFSPRSVEVGTRVGTTVAIERGLSKDETVVVRGAFLLDSESRLESSLRRGPASSAEEPAPSGAAPTGHEGHGP